MRSHPHVCPHARDMHLTPTPDTAPAGGWTDLSDCVTLLDSKVGRNLPAAHPTPAMKGCPTRAQAPCAHNTAAPPAPLCADMNHPDLELKCIGHRTGGSHSCRHACTHADIRRRAMVSKCRRRSAWHEWRPPLGKGPHACQLVHCGTPMPACSPHPVERCILTRSTGAALRGPAMSKSSPPPPALRSPKRAPGLHSPTAGFSGQEPPLPPAPPAPP